MTAPDPEFMPGLELSRILYVEAVRPILDRVHPGLTHAAARVGTGSEVLGFDSPRSADHEWGPRLDLFLSPDDVAEHGGELRRLLSERLPKQVRGWPTHFRPGTPEDPVGVMELTDGPVSHRVSVNDVDGWLGSQLGSRPGLGTARMTPFRPTAADWLAMPQQKLAEVTGGAVFHDGLGTLTAARLQLAWYPDEVWRYLLACQWQRVSQEEAFVGRCAEVGDELGSAVVAGRLVRDLVRLCLLLGRQYAPYGKWLGSAFGQLPVAEGLLPSLRGAVTAPDHPARERYLCDAYEIVGALQNRTGLAEPVDPTRRRYHSRPFQVLHAERFAGALVRTITDPALCALPLPGSVDQWADNTDFLARRGAARAAVDALGDGGESGRVPGN